MSAEEQRETLIQVENQEKEQENGQEKTKAVNFIWKSKEQELAFDAAVNEWKKVAPQGQQGKQDFIWHIFEKSKAIIEAESLENRAKSLNIDQLLAAWENRRKADQATLEIILETVASAEDMAKIKVKGEIENIKAKNTELEKKLLETQKEIEKIRALEEENKGLWSAKMELIENEKILKGKFDQATDDIKEAIKLTKQMQFERDQARAEAIQLKEENLKIKDENIQLKSEADTAKRILEDSQTMKAELLRLLANKTPNPEN